jgi:hypothetical protein
MFLSPCFLTKCFCLSFFGAYIATSQRSLPSSYSVSRTRDHDMHAGELSHPFPVHFAMQVEASGR